MNEIPDDQEITDEARPSRDPEFLVQAGTKLRVRRCSLAEALAQSFSTKLAQICLARLARRRRVFGILRDPEFQLEIATLGDRERIRNRLRMFRKERAHFVGGFEIKLRHITHPPFVLHHLAGADADHDVVRFVVAALEKMHVVCRDKSEPKFLRESSAGRGCIFAAPRCRDRASRERNFPRRKYREIRRAGARLVELIGLDRHVDLALETAAHPNQTRGVRSEQFLVDPRLVMHAVEMRDRHQLDQIAVTRSRRCARRVK